MSVSGIKQMMASLELGAADDYGTLFISRRLAPSCASAFEQHGYGSREDALQTILDCPRRVLVTGGIMVRAAMRGDWFCDIDVFVRIDDLPEVVAYLGEKLKLPVIEDARKPYYEHARKVVHLGTVLDVVGVDGDVETAIQGFDISICRAFVDNKNLPNVHVPTGFTQGFAAAKPGTKPERIEKYEKRGVKFV